MDCIVTATKSPWIVLLLHGWAQNARVFSHRTQTLHKKLTQRGIECRYLEAPISLPPLLDDENSMKETGRSDAKAWFLYNGEDPSDRSMSLTGQALEYVGIQQTVNLIRAELETIPLDQKVCLLGFSQGAVFLHYISGMLSHGSLSSSEAWGKIRKVVLISGFPATPLNLTDSSQHKLSNIPIPSLHILGKKDSSVPTRHSFDLARRFVHAKIFEHDKGHVVPQQSAACKAIGDFILGQDG